MQTALLKEYVSKAKDLELSCYEQKLLCDNLEQKLSHINYQRKNKENEKKEFKKFSWINYIASAIWWGISVLPPLIGISMLVGVATTIENSLQNIENNEITRRYYEEITARNTSYLAWTAYKFNYKI